MRPQIRRLLCAVSALAVTVALSVTASPASAAVRGCAFCSDNCPGDEWGLALCWATCGEYAIGHECLEQYNPCDGGAFIHCESPIIE